MSKLQFEGVNPILFKELSQGMRSKAYISVFIITQCILIAVTLFIISLGDSRGGSDNVSLMFWASIALSFIVLMPLQALNSIYSEVKSKTLEMLFLSRLSAKRIILGKFYCNLVQTLMISSTILPYIVLRYFAGGVNILMEMLLLVTFIFISSLITACCVTVSAYSVRNVKTHVIRQTGILFFMFMGFPPVLAIISFASGTGAMVSVTSSGGVASEWIDYVVILAMCPFVVMQILALGMSQVAPKSENNQYFKRMNCFAILMLYLVTRYFCLTELTCIPVLFCMFISAAEGIASGDYSYISSYKEVVKSKFFKLLLAPSLFMRFIWLNFSLLICLSLMATNIAVAEYGISVIWTITIPLGILVLFFLQLTLVNRQYLSNIMLFCSIFFIPLSTMFLYIYIRDFIPNIDHDFHIAIAVIYSMITIAVMSYAGALIIARLRKDVIQPLMIAIVAVVLIAANFILFVARDYYDDFAYVVLPLEIISLINYRRVTVEGLIKFPIMIHIELLVSVSFIFYYVSNSTC